jgi:hypothetical protein
LPPFLVTPRLERLGELTLASIAGLATAFRASVTATAVRAIRTTKQPLILVAHNLLGRTWQWPSVTAGGIRVRDDIDHRSSSFLTLNGRMKRIESRKEPAHYWFDRRHIEQFDVKVDSLQTVEGEVLSLVRILDPRMTEIYGR